MTNFRKIITYAASSVCILGSGVYLKDHFIEKNTLKAAWTTSYEPSVKWDHNWDRRHPESLTKPNRRSSVGQNLVDQKNENSEKKTTDDFEIGKKSSKASRHLFLIRHGQYEINAKDKDLMVLTPLGREQAELTGIRLSELTQNFKFNKIHHSTMIRAIETADIIRTKLPKDIPVHVDPLLCEGAPIPPEPPVGHWKPEFYFFQDGSRIEAAFRKYFFRAPPEQLEDSYELVVCHANVIRYFFCRALQFPAEAWLRFGLNHGSITHIVIRPDGRVACKFLGESGYMPITKTSS
ncbi:unnamed protein product [Brachionus calyciflorus]|uniref:Serine/threonine-protein phosphatase PGAM5, mitochondrial n=1 Tax=Brachionus calyciflorus TaxID=104777 RepID=A0A813MC33_9BILA|nr:unnamed protein product [Brachionus calyciflorus]